jgi:tetratricopeptide (TPR) repeat protein
MHRSLRSIGALALLLVVGSDPLARQGDERLDPLFSRLLTAASEEEAQSIERSIWVVWSESGREDIDQLMQQGVEALSYRLLDVALKIFDRVVDLDPQFAEGWNKRATVLWLLDRNEESMEDIRRTLALEPRHFGAISGMGLILIEAGDKAGALKAFEEVLKISPSSPGAKHHIERLRALMQGESV